VHLKELLLQKAKTVSKITGCEENFELARLWLARCLEKHPACNIHTSKSHPLPTRLLDVNANCSSTLRLIIPGDQTGQYATLSHVWGKQQIVKSTKETISSHLKEIDVSGLSRTFNDAVKIARSLRVRYLWVDSLCIIQNSVEDWSREAAMMGQYYKNALFTIAAVSSPDGHTGCFLSREPLCLTPCPVDVKFNPGEEPKSGFVHPSLGWDPVEDTTGFQRPPLWQRAWVVQERLLSSRLLQFSSMQMSWRCCSEEASERVPEGVAKYIKLSSLEKVLRPTILGLRTFPEIMNSESIPSDGHAEELLDLYNAWYDLIILYGKCHLTVKSDVFPAISGIARAIADATGDKYCAGLWKSDIHRGLLWSAPDSTSSKQDLRILRAPSWSWASLPATCSFIVRQIFQVNTQTAVLDVKSIELTFNQDDQFGAVEEGRLNISGLLKKAQTCPENLPVDPVFDRIESGKREHTLFDLTNQSTLGYYVADNIDRRLLTELWCLPVMTEAGMASSRRVKDALRQPPRQARGLALVPLNLEAALFMRVGSIWILDFDWFMDTKPSLLSII
jgi:hypothetical protein